MSECISCRFYLLSHTDEDRALGRQFTRGQTVSKWCPDKLQLSLSEVFFQSIFLTRLPTEILAHKSLFSALPEAEGWSLPSQHSPENRNCSSSDTISPEYLFFFGLLLKGQMFFADVQCVMRSNKWMLMNCFCRKLCAADNSCVCSLLCQINAAVGFPGYSLFWSIDA